MSKKKPKYRWQYYNLQAKCQCCNINGKSKKQKQKSRSKQNVDQVDYNVKNRRQSFGIEENVEICVQNIELMKMLNLYTKLGCKCWFEC